MARTGVHGLGRLRRIPASVALIALFACTFLGVLGGLAIHSGRVSVSELLPDISILDSADAVATSPASPFADRRQAPDKDRGKQAAAAASDKGLVQRLYESLRNGYDEAVRMARDWLPWGGDGTDAARQMLADDRAPVERDKDLELEEESQPEDWPLERQQAISGRVLDQGGMPVAGIGLVASPIRLFDLPEGAPISSADARRQAVTDGTGRYLLPALAAGEYRVKTLRTPEFAEGQVVVRSGIDYADIVLVGQREIVVHGQVIDTSGTPLAGALVTPKVVGGRAGYSDAQGAYEVRIPLRGNSGFAILARLDGFKDSIQRVAKGGATGDGNRLDITLEPVTAFTSVSGTVEDRDGTPLAARLIQLYSPVAPSDYRTTTGPDGRYSIIGVQAGDSYAIRVLGDKRFRAFERSQLSVPAKGLELDIVLDRQDLGSLSGQVANASGEPVPNLSMTLRSELSATYGVQVTTDGSGSFFVPEAPTGRVVLESRSAPRFMVTGLEIAPGSDLRTPITLDWGRYELRGQLVDAHNNPIAVPRVTLWWAQRSGGIRSWISRETAADSQGYFVFTNIGPGPHVVQVNAPGFRQVDLKHDVARQGFDVRIQLVKKG